MIILLVQKKNESDSREIGVYEYRIRFLKTCLYDLLEKLSALKTYLYYLFSWNNKHMYITKKI